MGPMARFGQFWTGLLMAGALALVLALFGLSTASAHGVAAHDGASHDAVAPAAMSALSGPAHHHAQTARAHGVSHGMGAALLTADQADCHKGPALAAARSDKPAKKDHAPGCRCHDGCACGCASACVAHAMTGLPAGAAALPAAVAAVRLPLGRSDDPAGLKTPPEPRPPLSI